MKLFITITFTLLIAFGFGQQPETKFVEALDSFGLARPQEKSYLQTDRTQYVAGETIWFKAYTTLFEQRSILSKLVYVTLTNNQGLVIDKKQFKLENGTAAGDLELKSDLASGEYFLNVYTLWMLNFPSYIHGKKIIVYNTTNNPSAKATAVANDNTIRVHFFPEGGQMIEGLAGNIAFKALDAFGRPANISGNILDSKNNSVAPFATKHDGMGIVNFTPAPGEVYTAQVKGNSEKIPLPQALKEGITVTADNSNLNKTFIKLERSPQNKASYKELLLVAQKNYEVVYMAKINFDEGMDAVAINKKNLGPGIMQVTVFTSTGVPIAERAIFVSNYDIPQVRINTAGKNKREKSLFEIDLSGYENPEAAVSVVNYLADNTKTEQNILSGLLLTSDLKGNIHQPAYYFGNKDSLTLQHLDLLMMVNGWSRYQWQDLLANKYSTLKYPFETGLSVTGKVMHVNEKTPLKAGKINLIVKAEDSTTIMSEATVGNNSDFIVTDIDYKGSGTIYYQGTNQKNEKGMVSAKVNPSYFDSLRQFMREDLSVTGTIEKITPPSVTSMVLEKQKKEDDKIKLMKEVVVVSKKLSPADSITRLYASPIFEMSDQTLIMDNGHYFDIWQFLQRMVPGISINKTDTGKFVTFDRYNGLNFFSEGTPSGVQFFLNEVPVSVDIVDYLNPEDVSLVKVFKGVTGIALGADRGAIAVYTKKGGTKTDWRTKGFDFVKKAGYSVKREFYEMDYSRVKPDAGIIDHRPTLLWQPNVKIVNGKAIIEFFNDDTANQFKLTLEGIDSKGRLFFAEKIIE